VSPQTDSTSPTQMLSHRVWQQKGSTSQISVLQTSQPFFSLVPVLQIAWLHVPLLMPPEELLLLLDELLLLLEELLLDELLLLLDELLLLEELLLLDELPLPLLPLMDSPLGVPHPVGPS
jgi:hypothetical protein